MTDSLEDFIWEARREEWIAEQTRHIEEQHARTQATIKAANEAAQQAGVYIQKRGARITGSIIDEIHNWKQIGWVSEDGFDLGNQYARELPSIGGGTITLVLDPSMEAGGYRIIHGKPADKHPPAHPPYKGLKEAINQPGTTTEERQQEREELRLVSQLYCTACQLERYQDSSWAGRLQHTCIRPA